MTRRILKTRLHFWISNRRVDRWAKEANLFFVLALGRSGTSFLAHLLNQAEGAHVPHEPVGEDIAAYRGAFNNAASASRCIAGFRKKEIYLRARSLGLKSYGEVNSHLRRHAPALVTDFQKRPSWIWCETVEKLCAPCSPNLL